MWRRVLSWPLMSEWTEGAMAEPDEIVELEGGVLRKGDDDSARSYLRYGVLFALAPDAPVEHLKFVAGGRTLERVAECFVQDGGVEHNLLRKNSKNRATCNWREVSVSLFVAVALPKIA